MTSLATVANTSLPRPDVAAITGASRGLGAAMAKRLAASGTRVILLGRSEKVPAHERLQGTLNDVRDEILESGGDAVAVHMDLTDSTSIRTAIQRAATSFGKLDVLINNASALDTNAHPKARKYDLLHAVNARGTYLCNQACLPFLLQTGGQILTVAPPLDNMRHWLRQPQPPLAYMVSKYNMSMYTLALAPLLSVQTLWPKHTIQTAATRLLEEHSGQPMFTDGRDPEYFARAVSMALAHPVNGRACLDEDILPHPRDTAPLDLLV